MVRDTAGMTQTPLELAQAQATSWMSGIMGYDIVTSGMSVDCGCPTFGLRGRYSHWILGAFFAAARRASSSSSPRPRPASKEAASRVSDRSSGNLSQNRAGICSYINPRSRELP